MTLLADTSTNPSKLVAAEFRAEIARLAISKAELAQKLQMHPSALSRLLSGTNPLSLDAASQLADELGVPLSVLLERAESRADEPKTAA